MLKKDIYLYIQKKGNNTNNLKLKIMEKLNSKNLKIEGLPKGMMIDFENSIIVMKKAV